MSDVKTKCRKAMLESTPTVKEARKSNYDSSCHTMEKNECRLSEGYVVPLDTIKNGVNIH